MKPEAYAPDPPPKRPAKVVSPSGVQYFLRNRYHIGVITWKGIENDGNHPHLIDHHTFDRVQRILDTNHQGDSGSSVWKHKHQAQGQLEAAATRTVDMEKKLDNAVKPLKDCFRIYRDASDTVRRQLDSELFDTLVIDDEALTASKSEIYEALTAPDLLTVLTDELDELKGGDGQQDGDLDGSAAEDNERGDTSGRGSQDSVDPDGARPASAQTKKNRTSNRAGCGSRIRELVELGGIEPPSAK